VPASGPVIFVFEDNPSDLELIRLALELHAVDCVLLTVNHGDEAASLLHRVGRDLGKPSLVIMDLNLPGIEGLSLLRLLRRRWNAEELPVIVVSSSDAPKDRGEATALGIREFFSKPSDLDAFMKLGAIVSKCLADVAPSTASSRA
jgi:CheY-like chemotaxis protein